MPAVIGSFSCLWFLICCRIFAVRLSFHVLFIMPHPQFVFLCDRPSSKELPKTNHTVPIQYAHYTSPYAFYHNIVRISHLITPVIQGRIHHILIKTSVTLIILSVILPKCNH